MEEIKAKRFIECKDCKKMYHCEKTSMLGCFDGKAWTIDEQRVFRDCVNKSEAVEKKVAELKKAMSELMAIYKPQSTWRGVRMDFWQHICTKYKESDLLNADGDIFFIDEKVDSEYFIGRRVLWNLELSKEQYNIYSYREMDSDGELDYITFEVELKND